MAARDNVASLKDERPRRRGERIPISAERLSEMIGDIYECVLDPQKWEMTLLRINRAFSFANSVLGIIPFRPGGQVVNVNAGLDPDWLAIADDDSYRADAIALWGGAGRADQFPLDEPIVHSQAVGSAILRGNRYFETILKPRKLHDAVMIAVAREPSLMGYAAFNRHVSAGAVGDMEVAGLRLLAPHIRRAVTISNLFDMKAVEAATFGAALDALAFGVVLVDDELQVIHANGKADEMLTAEDPISTVKGALTLPTEPATKALLDAVERAARDEMAVGQRGIGIPAALRSGAPCVVHVLPLKRERMRGGILQRAVAALFVVPADAGARTPTHPLALLYNLTPAEARVFELIAAGSPKTEIAASLGIAVSTVNTHLLQVFAKTGCKRQADLSRLAGSVSLPG